MHKSDVTIVALLLHTTEYTLLLMTHTREVLEMRREVAPWHGPTPCPLIMLWDQVYKHACCPIFSIYSSIFIVFPIPNRCCQCIIYCQKNTIEHLLGSDGDSSYRNLEEKASLSHNGLHVNSYAVLKAVYIYESTFQLDQLLIV